MNLKLVYLIKSEKRRIKFQETYPDIIVKPCFYYGDSVYYIEDNSRVVNSYEFRSLAEINSATKDSSFFAIREVFDSSKKFKVIKERLWFLMDEDSGRIFSPYNYHKVVVDGDCIKFPALDYVRGTSPILQIFMDKLDSIGVVDIFNEKSVSYCLCNQKDLQYYFRKISDEVLLLNYNLNLLEDSKLFYLRNNLYSCDDNSIELLLLEDLGTMKNMIVRETSEVVTVFKDKDIAKSFSSCCSISKSHSKEFYLSDDSKVFINGNEYKNNYEINSRVNSIDDLKIDSSKSILYSVFTGKSCVYFAEQEIFAYNKYTKELYSLSGKLSKQNSIDSKIVSVRCVDLKDSSNLVDCLNDLTSHLLGNPLDFLNKKFSDTDLIIVEDLMIGFGYNKSDIIELRENRKLNNSQVIDIMKKLG